MSRIKLVAVLSLALACDPTEPDGLPAELTGAWCVVSITLAGLTETPPRVSGELGLLHHSVEDGWAAGTLRLQMRREGPTGSGENGGWGEYRHNANGRMVMSVDGDDLDGSYLLNGDTLITHMLPEPTFAITTPGGEIVWVRRKAPSCWRP